MAWTRSFAASEPPDGSRWGASEVKHSRTTVRFWCGFARESLCPQQVIAIPSAIEVEAAKCQMSK